jgi:hypothetical protein
MQDSIDVHTRLGALAGEQSSVKRGRWCQGSAFLLATSETVRPHYIAVRNGGTLRATEGGE